MEVKGKILAKYKDNRALKLNDDKWYNLADNVKPYLDKVEKGDEVTLTYEKKGTALTVIKLVKGSAEKTEETTKQEPEKSTTGFVCEDCGKELKDGKFKKCFMCNKKSPTKGKSGYKSYDSPEKTAQIQRGNALNAAASVASTQQFEDPEVAKQFTLLLAEDFLEWLRAE